MSRFAIIFIVIAVLAAVAGFSGIAGAFGNLVWWVCAIFVVMAVVGVLYKR